jgi:hypothetical protein
MDIYAEVHQKRAERFARRQERYEREARRERVLGPVRYGIQVVFGALIFYGYLFAACLWASM